MSAVYSFDQKDASALAQNPLAGLLSGGFNFSPQRTYGGRGNALTATPTATATLTPTLTAATSASPPFADGIMGFRGGAGLSPVGFNLTSLAIPAGLVLLAVILYRMRK